MRLPEQRQVVSTVGSITTDGTGIGKLTRVSLREVWKHEVLDFTRWLEENLDVANDHLDVPLVSAERESRADSR